MVLLQAERLKVVVEIGAESDFKTVTVEAEQTLQTIHVVGSSVLERNGLELFVDSMVEMVTQKVRPEPEQSIHFR
jgi:hypothetical protein